VQLSQAETRRLTLAAQGFGRRPARPTTADVRRVAAKVLAIQMDTINVLVRSPYLPAYSRLGPYSMHSLDKLASTPGELFECWGHATSLMPVALFPIMRYRMADWAARDPMGPRGERPDDGYIEQVYREVAARGPITVAELSDPGESRGKWWGWRDGKIAVEYLWNCGRLAIAGRENFTRLYDLVERVIPADILDAPAPDREESQRQLMCLTAKSVGVASAHQLADYFGLRQNRARVRGSDGKLLKPIWPRLLRELVEEGRLVQVEVEDWPEAGYAVPGARVPKSIDAQALLSPFDSMMWGSADLCFDFGNPLAQQLYVPAERRIFGYYVLPFLLGDALVGRCDLKADRSARTLLVQGAFAEPEQDTTRIAGPLADELALMQTWLELDRIEVADNGDLATALRKNLHGR
jgi:uncharacterized protein YcaQ